MSMIMYLPGFMMVLLHRIKRRSGIIVLKAWMKSCTPSPPIRRNIPPGSGLLSLKQNNGQEKIKIHKHVPGKGIINVHYALDNIHTDPGWDLPGNGRDHLGYS